MGSLLGGASATTSKDLLIQAFQEALTSLTLADLVRPYWAQQDFGWFRIRWADSAWEVHGPQEAPGNAYGSPPEEVWVDLGIESDNARIAAIDDDVRATMHAEGLDPDDWPDVFRERCQAAYENILALEVVHIPTVVDSVLARLGGVSWA